MAKSIVHNFFSARHFHLDKKIISQNLGKKIVAKSFVRFLIIAAAAVVAVVVVAAGSAVVVVAVVASFGKVVFRLRRKKSNHAEEEKMSSLKITFLQEKGRSVSVHVCVCECGWV